MKASFKIEIVTDYIKLDQALKFCGVAASGSEAKEIISSGEVYINGESETRRGKKLYKGDKFTVFEKEYEIE